MSAADKRVNKKATNNEYLKTMDIVQSNMDIGEIIKRRIVRKLEHAGGQQSLHAIVIREKANRLNDNTSTQSSDTGSSAASKSSLVADRNREVPKEKQLRSHRLKNISNTHLLVATLIATVTFAAGFTLPGGNTDEGPNKGKPVFSTHLAFKAFLLSDVIAFYCSPAAVLLHFFASLEQNYHLRLRFIKFSAILTYVSILCMVTAFTSGIYLLPPKSSETLTATFVLGCLFLSFCIFGAPSGSACVGLILT